MCRLVGKLGLRAVHRLSVFVSRFPQSYVCVLVFFLIMPGTTYSVISHKAPGPATYRVTSASGIQREWRKKNAPSFGFGSAGRFGQPPVIASVLCPSSDADHRCATWRVDSSRADTFRFRLHLRYPFGRLLQDSAHCPYYFHSSILSNGNVCVVKFWCSCKILVALFNGF